MSDGPKKTLVDQEMIKARLRQLWHGEIPLVETFWLYFFAGVVILSVLSSIDGLIGLAFELAMVVWAGFMAKPVFVAADRYKGERYWAILAKIAVVVILIEVILDLVSF